MTTDKQPKENRQFKLALLRYYKWLTLLIVIIIVAASYYFIFEPKYQQVGVGGSYNTRTLTIEISKRQDYLRQLEKLVQNYQQINQAQIARLEHILPEQKDVAGLFVQFETLAKKNNFVLAGITITEAADEASQGKSKTNPPLIKKLNVSLNLVGVEISNSYNEVKNFLDDVEKNLRLFDVNAVYFDADSTNYSVELFTYYFDKK